MVVNIMAEERNLLIVDMVKKKKKNMKVIRKEKNMKDVREKKKEKNIIKVIEAGLKTYSNDNMKKKAVNGGKKKDKNKVISSEKS